MDHENYEESYELHLYRKHKLEVMREEQRQKIYKSEDEPLKDILHFGRNISIGDKPYKKSDREAFSAKNMHPKNHNKEWTEKRNKKLTKLFITDFNTMKSTASYQDLGKKLGRTPKAIELQLVKLKYISDPYNSRYAFEKKEKLVRKFTGSQPI